MNIIASQQGSRENYNMAKALRAIADEFVLYTDFFNKAPYNSLFKNYQHRFDKNLAPYVQHSALAFFKHKLIKAHQNTIDENYDAWLAKQIVKSNFKTATFFTFSYNCNKALQAAKNKGYTTIMGQINPGPKEAEMVEKEYLKYYPNEKFSVPSKAYWKHWEASLPLVDVMLVNSAWSKNQMLDYFPNEKIEIVPLVANAIDKTPKSSANTSSPIKFIYAGALSVRKGFCYLKQALDMLKNSNFELHIIGRLNGPKSFLEYLPNHVFYHGQKSHQEVLNLMQASDVFINSTLSDGFALTQLEAVAAGLPSIFTANCAKVYAHHKNGIEIAAFSAESIAMAMDYCIENPREVEKFKSNLPDLSGYALSSLQKRLSTIIGADITRS